jgi:hypothetical protein
VVLAAQRSAQDQALAPIVATLRDIEDRHGNGPVHGLVPGLAVRDPGGWVPTSEFTSGRQLPALLDAAKQRWRAQSHAAAALAFKAYAYWVALPALIGYASARRVPLPYPASVLARYAERQPLLTMALYRPMVAVLPGDPLATSGATDILICDDDAGLREALRRVLIEEHLEPVVEQLRQRAHLGQRTLWGSLASGVAHGLVQAADSVPGPISTTIDELLDAFGVADLVDVRPDPATGRLTVERRTCCLAFTLPEPKICASCCIR